MIHACADRIASIIAADHAMLRQMSDFLGAVTGDPTSARSLPSCRRRSRRVARSKMRRP